MLDSWIYFYGVEVIVGVPVGVGVVRASSTTKRPTVFPIIAHENDHLILTGLPPANRLGTFGVPANAARAPFIRHGSVS
jgi:hypothetical protein